MKLSEKAQHALEYIILMTLIMAGIIIGGPYAIRSWNAQMKGWEDSVIDSMNDPLTEAPPDIVSIPGCDFVSWQNEGCGLGYSLFGNSRNCTAQQMLQLGVFSLQDCQLSDPSISFDLVARCDTNTANNCCTPWMVTPSGCTPGDPGCPRDSDCGTNSPLCPTTKCGDGEYCRTRSCDSEPPEMGCVADTNCDFTCGDPGQPAPNSGLAYGGFCDGSEQTGLTGDTPYTYLDPGAACTPLIRCEVKCSPTFIATGGIPPCDCPAGKDDIDMDGVCECATGYAEQCSSGPNAGNSSYCNICNTGPNAGDPAYCQR